ncbi:hypothetical protein RHECIAT_CH0002500 [Rhizobium etli CIAT 652]|uniref:Uncharacterized protein n=1 Tax=Rhizobium etli (strain CIAT 652) TaxID=491916 RepID=B3PQM9_RHIE6|nr:hypothetical protein RHECIAT_CH0002500 [Rhizobium etli CIAT 652]KKZ85683.1 hypothetical protein RPHASCH2410_CH20325 [Rhizobium phaseoli Ch24-10]
MITSFAPSRAKTFAAARPMPELAPVMIADLSFRSAMSISPQLSRHLKSQTSGGAATRFLRANNRDNSISMAGHAKAAITVERISKFPL